MPAPPQIRRLSLVEEVRDRLRQDILSGALEAGERITEQGIAERMGTSAGPVREALAGLIYEGLVVTLPHRGTFVSEVSEDEARAAYEIRALLEPYAFERAIPRLTPAHFEELRRILASWRDAAEREDFTSMISLDMSFHRIFFDCSGSALLSTLWPAIEGTIRKFVVVAGPQYGRDYHEVLRTHERLLSLVEAGEIRAIRKELAQHGHDIWRNLTPAQKTHAANRLPHRRGSS